MLVVVEGPPAAVFSICNLLRWAYRAKAPEAVERSRQSLAFCGSSSKNVSNLPSQRWAESFGSGLVLDQDVIFALRRLSLGPLGRRLGYQGSRMPGLDLVHDVKHLFRGTPSCAEGLFRFRFWPVVRVTFPARCRTIDCSNSLLIFHASFHSGSLCWKYDIASKNPNTISTTFYRIPRLKFVPGVQTSFPGRARS